MQDSFPIHDPHSYLGLHRLSPEQSIIRLFRPDAHEVFLEFKGEIVQASPTSDPHIFEYLVDATADYLDYRIYHHSGSLSFDPYSFWPTVGDLDLHLFSQGVHYELYKVLGAHPTTHQDVEGVKFAVWAPMAKSVSLIADFNHWDANASQLRSMGVSGIWELFVPGIGRHHKYKFVIKTVDGKHLIKSDPFAHFCEYRPKTASIVEETHRYVWNDEAWQQAPLGPMIVYEVHLGSWKKDGEHFLNYRVIAHALSDYVKEMGFTHVELLPVMEHPLDESWGYQVTGFFAPTSRFGSVQDFQYLVDHLHQQGIGVILDWVPAHFPTDSHGLSNFDGTSLYEHEDPKKGFHPHWNTSIFNYGRKEVSNFLIASALFWLSEMHIDGLRVDAVASMLYLDYGREEGQWLPNSHGGKENLEAIEFLKHLNSCVHQLFPKALMIAEESTSYYGVTHPLLSGGLGFDMKWNMGWMNDTLAYFSTNCLFRKHHQNKLSFGQLYAYSERFQLVLSHDEVVHGKKSLLSKMPGDMWQQFTNLRLLYSYMITSVGKKLLFMGGEIGQWNEWDAKKEIEWPLLQYQTHQGLQRLVKEINGLYHRASALWEKDDNPDGFEWVDLSDVNNCVIAYLRKSSSQILLVVHNFTPSAFEHYSLPLFNVKTIKELFNTDELRFGGSGIETSPVIGEGVICSLPPLATLIFEVYFDLL